MKFPQYIKISFPTPPFLQFVHHVCIFKKAPTAKPAQHTRLQISADAATSGLQYMEQALVQDIRL